jgi:hypothetical protein
VCVVALTAATAVLTFGRVGTIHGKTTRIYLTAARARGVIEGTPVWLDGMRVGAVRWVHFRDPSVDTSSRLLIALDVVTDADPRIRRDTRAEIRPGTSRIGSPVVALQGGHRNSPTLGDGDTLVARPDEQFSSAREQVAAAAQSLPVVLANISSVRDQLFSRSGTIGALTNESDARPFRQLRLQAVQRLDDSAYRRGTVALMLDDACAARIHQTLGHTNTLLERSGDRAHARTPGDSTLAHAARDVDRDLSTLRTGLARYSSDSTLPGSLQSRIADARHQLRALGTDVAHHALRYLTF